MNRKRVSRARSGESNTDLRHLLGIIAFGLFALVILLLVLFPQLRPGGEEEEGPPVVASETELLVLAASSLTEPLSEAARAYEAAHPEWKLRLSFAASNTLRRQIEAGAPADFFLSASPAPVEALVRDSWVLQEQAFVMWTTELVIITPLAEDDAERKESPPTPRATLLDAKRIAIGDRGVPVGEYGRQALEASDLLDSLTDRLIPLPNETAVLEAVASRACDRGIVYAASVHGARNAERVRSLASFPVGSHDPVSYQGAILAKSPHAGAVMDFLLYLTEGDGGTIMREAGFTAPVHPMH